MHGIYAGDIDRLSAQALIGPLRNMEATGIISSLFNSMLSSQKRQLFDDYIAAEIARTQYMDYLKGNSSPDATLDARQRRMQSTTLTFKQGTQQLVDAIAAHLAKSKKVTIKTSSDVQAMSLIAGHDQISVGSSLTHDCIMIYMLMLTDYLSSTRPWYQSRQL
jgi:oxygen-dependent protoporphyrinogen oxidase